MAGPAARVRDTASGTAFRRVSVPHLFREIARAHAGLVALSGDDESITYRDLDVASNRVAHALLERGRPGRPFAAVAGLDIASVTVLIGAVKAGHPFVPLDIRESPQKWLSVCSETGALLTVPDEAARAAVRAHVQQGLVESEGTRILNGAGEQVHRPECAAWTIKSRL